jgi:hypothetical protein
VSIGNDIVDLSDPETRHEGLHPRFDQRVFRSEERARLESSDSSRTRHVLRWALWAAKESAYKALKRLDPALVFSPSQFAVELPALSSPVDTAVGQVVHGDQAFDLQVHLDGPSLHAVAGHTSTAGAQLLWKVDRALSDHGTTVRRLAATGIASALGLDSADIEITHRPPVALHRGRTLVTDVSLSHHGRFVAFACALPH